MNSPPEHLATFLRAALPADGHHLLEQAGRLAEEQGLAIYLVGGAVRDLLLGIDTHDLDLVVEGNAPLLAQGLVALLGGALAQRSQFGTVKFAWQDWVVDLATARAEYYPRPGSLPKVRPADILRDLGRRDFTVNTMAVCLKPDAWGQLLDPFEGRADLAQKLLRVLHNRSFQDDATRILRALRYEQRLGFDLEPHTESLLRQDVGYLETISGPRIWRELELIFQEERLEYILRRMEEMEALKAIHPALRLTTEFEESLARARRWPQFEPTPVFFLGLLAYPLPQEEREAIIRRLRLAGEKARVLQHLGLLKDKLPLLGQPDALPSRLAAELAGLHPQAIGAASVCAPSELVRERLKRYLENWRYVKTSLRGHDLQRLGVASGPMVGQALAALRDARLDGQVASREQEKAFVKEWLRNHAPPAT